MKRAQGPGATLVVLGLCALSAAAIAGNGAFALAGMAIDRGAAQLERAGSTPRGSARDALLDQAQSNLKTGLAIAAGDARGWDLMGETRWMQATAAQARGVSPTLLADARMATETAARLAPQALSTQVRMAAIESLAPDGADRAAAWVARSYLNGGDRTVDARRVIAAARVWAALDAPTQQAVLREACAVAATGEAGANALSAAIEEDARTGAAMGVILNAARCV